MSFEFTRPDPLSPETDKRCVRTREFGRVSYVADGEQTAVKEEEDAEDHEERAKGGEGDTDLWQKSAAGRGDRGGRALGVREPDHHCWRGTVVGRMKILLESTIGASSSSVAVAKTSRRVSCRVVSLNHR